MSPRIVNLSNLPTFTAVNLNSDQGAIGGPVIVPQCAQIVLGWLLTDGKLAHNVLYGRYAGAFGGSQVQANQLLAAFGGGATFTALKAHLAPSTVLNSVTIRDVNTANQPLVSSNTGAVVGTGTGAALPAEVAAVVTLRTALSGRANRGRAYIPGFDTSALGAGDVILAAVVTQLAAWAATWISVMAASNYTFVLGQKARAAYTGTTGTEHAERKATSQMITSTEVRDNHWDSQRRRGLK
jgi:hypothetical protein